VNSQPAAVQREPWLDRLRSRHFAVRVGQFVALLVAYQLARILAAPEGAAAAIDHANQVIDLERRLGLSFENELWEWVGDHVWIERLTVAYYRTAHVALAGAFFIWLWLMHPARFRAVWWWFWTAHVIALAIMAVYPTAPPRLVPELGFSSDPGTWLGPELRNDYAAIPSLHVGYPVMFAAVLIAALDTRARWLALLWPVTTWYAVMATANHFWFDAAAGVVVVTASLPLGLALRRIRDTRRGHTPGASRHEAGPTVASPTTTDHGPSGYRGRSP